MFKHIAQIQYNVPIWQTPNTEYQHKQLKSGSGMVVQGLFCRHGTWEDVVIELNMTPSV